jgi:hypothetical protein
MAFGFNLDGFVKSHFFITFESSFRHAVSRNDNMYFDLFTNPSSY